MMHPQPDEQLEEAIEKIMFPTHIPVDEINLHGKNFKKYKVGQVLALIRSDRERVDREARCDELTRNELQTTKDLLTYTIDRLAELQQLHSEAEQAQEEET